MGKLDKKVLKFITEHSENDLDAGDIAIDLRCDEDAVQEALDSLKDQDLVETVMRGGKMFWQLSSGRPPEESEAPEEPRHPGGRSDIDSETVSFDMSNFRSVARPVGGTSLQREKPIADVPRFSPPNQSAFKEKDSMDDEESDESSNGLSPVAGIVIAVVLSVAISAVVTMMIAGGSKKSFAEGLQVIERAATGMQSKSDQRIEELSAQVKALSDKSASGGQLSAPSAVQAAPVVKPAPKAPVKQTARPATKAKAKPAGASAKAAKAVKSSKKKKDKDNKGAPSYFNPPDESSPAGSSEGASSSSSPDAAPSSTPPSSDQSAPPASSGSDDNSTPSAPAPSPEGGGN